jgi:hypothetical protein
MMEVKAKGTQAFYLSFMSLRICMLFFQQISISTTSSKIKTQGEGYKV